MSHRPPDWSPLAGSDPLPGDPDAIFDEAFRLRNMAAGFTDQVSRLRRIGADDSLVGASFGELRASALELSGKLEKVAARYAKVSGLLSSWAPELEDFQAATLKALDKALEAERQRARDPRADTPNPGVFAYQVFHATGLGDDTPTGADALLAEARTDLQRVLEEATARDRHWAHQIGQAIDDDLTDGFFDHVHQWVERNNHWIERLTDDLGWVTTGAALAALLIPGVGEAAALVELASIAETVGTVSGATVLAAHATQLAGGDTDAAFDLGLDVLALGSFGAAKLVAGRLGRTAEATRDAAAEAAGREAAQSMRIRTQEEYDRVMADPTSTPVAREAAQDGLDSGARSAAKAENDAASEVLATPESTANLGRVLLAGDREAADATADIEAMRIQHGEDMTVQRLAVKAHRLATAGRANFMAGTALDAADKTASNTDLKESYRGFKHWVVTGGPLR